MRLGFVQGPGAALPGGLSRDLGELRERGLIAGHVTAAAAYGGEHEAISVIGALDAAARRLGWDAAIAGPGRGSSARRRASATARWRRSTPPTRRSLSRCRRSSARGCRAPTRGRATAASATTRRRCSNCCWRRSGCRCPRPGISGWPLLDEAAPEGGSAQAALDDLIEITGGRHDLAVEPIDLDGYAASGLPARTMGRSIDDDPLFFAAPLAAGRALAGAVGG